MNDSPNVDKRGRLREYPFSFRQMQDGRVLLYWQGRQVRTLKGVAAQKFLANAANADASQGQLLMARVTGNFKRGNEKRKMGA